MARMTLGSWVGCAGIGVVLAAALLPQTRWIPLNHLDAISGGWQPGWKEFGISNGPYLPVGLTKAEQWVGASDLTRLAKAIAPTRDYQPDKIPARPYEQLRDYCLAHSGDATVWAQFVRLSGLSLHIPRPEETFRRPEDLERKKRGQEIAREVVDACQRAEKLDPENAFFPLMRASAQRVLGLRTEAQETFVAAGKLTNFNDYANLEADARWAAVFERWGYRGNVTRAYILASILLPDYSCASNLFSTLLDEEKGIDRLRVRVAGAEVGRLIAAKSPHIIGVFVGAGLFQAAVLGRRQATELTAGQLDAAVQPFRKELLEARIPDASVQKASIAFQRIRKSLPQTVFPPKDGSLDAFESDRTLYGAGVLLSILLVLPWSILVGAIGSVAARTWAPARRTRPVIGAVGLFVSAAAGAVIYCARLYDQESILGAVYPAVIALAAGCLITGLASRTSRVPWGWAVGLLSIGYLGMISWELHDDAVLGNLCESMLQEADRVRTESRAFTVLVREEGRRF